MICYFNKRKLVLTKIVHLKEKIWKYNILFEVIGLNCIFMTYSHENKSQSYNPIILILAIQIDENRLSGRNTGYEINSSGSWL